MDRSQSRRVQALIALALFLAGCDNQPTAKALEAPEEAVEASPEAPEVGPKVALGPPPWSGRRPANSGFPCAVEEVLASSCRRCHWEPPENDAPFSLAAWESTRQERSGKPIFILMGQMVQADLMPPLDLHLDPPVTPLTPAHKKVLIDWVEQGAPRSDDTCD